MTRNHWSRNITVDDIRTGLGGASSLIEIVDYNRSHRFGCRNILYIVYSNNSSLTVEYSVLFAIIRIEVQIQPIRGYFRIHPFRCNMSNEIHPAGCQSTPKHTHRGVVFV